jgi:hypothetical protein
LININYDYNIVIDLYIYHHIIIKLRILRLDSKNKLSPISEGIANIRIDNQPCNGIDQTTRHPQAQRTPRVATVHDAVKETIIAHLTLVHVFHAYASVDTPWVTHALSHYTSVRQRHTTLLSLGILYVSYVLVHFKCLFIWTQPAWTLNDTSGGYHLGALNFRSDHSPFFSFSILYFLLIASLDLQLCQPFDHLAKPHKTSIDRKGSITSGFQPLVFYR